MPRTRWKLTATVLAPKNVSLWVCHHPDQQPRWRNPIRSDTPHCAAARQLDYHPAAELVTVAEAVREIHALLSVADHRRECEKVPCTLCYAIKRLETALEALGLDGLTRPERSTP